MVEYYAGVIPIGLLASLEKVTTYVCKGCGRVEFYARDVAQRLSRRATTVYL